MTRKNYFQPSEISLYFCVFSDIVNCEKHTCIYLFSLNIRNHTFFKSEKSFLHFVIIFLKLSIIPQRCVLNIFFLFNFFVLHRSLKNLLLPSLFNLKEVKRIHEFSKVYTILFIVQHRTKNFPILSSFSHLFFVISSHKESVSSVKTTNFKKKKKKTKDKIL